MKIEKINNSQENNPLVDLLKELYVNLCELKINSIRKTNTLKSIQEDLNDVSEIINNN